MVAYLLIPLLLLLQHSPSTRFAWISDTHVGSPTGADDLAAAVGELNTRRDLDFVVISGDITEMGSTAELRTARSILDSLRIPLHIIPGNHDTKWSESGTTDFPRIFGAERFLTFGHGFALMGLHQGPRMRMTEGHFSPEDLRWADSSLAVVRTMQIPLIVVTHYPLDPGICNWFALLDRLKPMDVRLVLTGHGHANRVDSYEGVRGVMGRSLLRGAEPRGGYNIVSIADDSIIVREHIVGQADERPWYGVPWEAKRADGREASYPRPDFGINTTYPLVRRIWTFHSGQTITSPAAVSGDIAVVADVSGMVHALRVSDGSPLWTYRANGAIFGAPDAKEGMLAIGAADSTITLLDLRSGERIWQMRTHGAVVSAPRIEQGVVYAGGSDRCFRAIDLAAGTLRWSFDHLEGFVETRAAIHLNSVVFGAWDEHVYALDRAQGTARWTWEGDRRGRLYSAAACWPVAVHGKVFVAAPDRILSAIDLSNGKTVWRTEHHQVRESIGVSEDSSRIFVRTMRDSLIAIDATTVEPREIWTTNLGFGYDINAAMPMEREGVVFYATMNGLVSAVRSRDGGILWQHRLCAVPVNTLTPLSHSQVIATTFDGETVLLEARSE